MGDFSGFSKVGLDFLADLDAHDKAWFDAHRATYDAEIVPAAKAFVVSLGDHLRSDISEAIEAQPKTNGSIAPINNDLRFNPDASPYKDHLMFRFWEGPVKKSSAMLMVRLHPRDGIGFASGINIDDINRWRAAITDDDTGTSFATDLASLVEKERAEIVGADLKTVPKPYDADHARADLLRHKGFQVRFIDKTPASIGSAAFVGWCASRLERLAGIHHWLVDNIA